MTAIFFYETVLGEYCEKDPALGYELFKRMSEVMIEPCNPRGTD